MSGDTDGSRSDQLGRFIAQALAAETTAQCPEIGAVGPITVLDDWAIVVGLLEVIRHFQRIETSPGTFAVLQVAPGASAAERLGGQIFACFINRDLVTACDLWMAAIRETTTVARALLFKWARSAMRNPR